MHVNERCEEGDGCGDDCMNERDPYTGKLHIKGVSTGSTPRVTTPAVPTAGADPAVGTPTIEP